MIWAVGFALASLILAPFLIEASRKPVDAILQADAPGNFAVLSDGATHYRWDGPEGGPVVVMIHGLTSPSYFFDPIVTGINALGFRTLRYDLYGRGYSDRVRADHDADLYCRQLSELLDVLDVKGRVSLIGYSMGGGIATEFAARDADRIEYLVLLAPAGMAHIPTRLDRLMRDWPGLGEWLCRGLGAKNLHRQLAYIPDETLRDQLIAETRRQGVMPAILSSGRHFLRDDLEDAHERLMRAALPVLAIWGGRDSVIPPIAREILEEWNPEAQQFTIDDAEHGLISSHPREIVVAFGNFTDDFI